MKLCVTWESLIAGIWIASMWNGLICSSAALVILVLCSCRQGTVSSIRILSDQGALYGVLPYQFIPFFPVHPSVWILIFNLHMYLWFKFCISSCLLSLQANSTIIQSSYSYWLKGSYSILCPDMRLLIYSCYHLQAFFFFFFFFIEYFCEIVDFYSSSSFTNVAFDVICQSSDLCCHFFFRVILSWPMRNVDRRIWRIMHGFLLNWT